MEGNQKIKLNPIEDVLQLLTETFTRGDWPVETVSISQGNRRVLAEDIFSDTDIPEFPKATVDGYAVRGIGHTKQFKLLGKVDMGQSLDVALTDGTCAYVPTGGVVPDGADGMVMIEDTKVLENGRIEVNVEFESRQNIIEVGDDMRSGECILKGGSILRPQDIGVLATLGMTQIKVFRKPTIAMISTGDELIDISQTPTYGQIREINAHTLSALAADMGLEIKETSLAKDDYERIKELIKSAMTRADIVIISGGSSVGDKDYTKDILNEVTDYGVFVSGMAIKPGKPTLVAKHGIKPVIGLPGHPVSAIVIFKLIVGTIIKAWGFPVRHEHFKTMRLTGDIYAAKGRDTYQMVRIVETGEETLAYPTSGKSGMITLLSGSDGYVIIPKELGKLCANTLVTGYYFE